MIAQADGVLRWIGDVIAFTALVALVAILAFVAVAIIKGVMKIGSDRGGALAFFLGVGCLVFPPLIIVPTVVGVRPAIQAVARRVQRPSATTKLSEST